MILEIIKDSIISSWPLLAIVGSSYILIRICYLLNHREKISFSKEFFTLISILYILLLYQLVTKTNINEYSGINLMPFEEIMRWIDNKTMFELNVLGNIIVFIPFGYIISSYIKPKKIWTILTSTTIISLVIEYVQLHIGRSFDIDDIILNVVGAILGYLIYKIWRWIRKKLPAFMDEDWFKNLVCIVIILFIVIYVLQIMEISFKI